MEWTTPGFHESALDCEIDSTVEQSVVYVATYANKTQPGSRPTTAPPTPGLSSYF